MLRVPKMIHYNLIECTQEDYWVSMTIETDDRHGDLKKTVHNSWDQGGELIIQTRWGRSPVTAPICLR